MTNSAAGGPVPVGISEAHTCDEASYACVNDPFAPSSCDSEASYRKTGARSLFSLADPVREPVTEWGVAGVNSQGSSVRAAQPHLAKRCIDVALGALLVLVALPIVLIGAASSAAALRAWPFFVQHRVGTGGRRFRFWKVRTLPTDVAPYLDKYQLNLDSIPAISRLLRRFHIDELPQLFHVLSGKMSLVGPRPEMPTLHAQLPSAFAEDRVSVRPGCTGLWQISEANAQLIAEAPHYDEYYLRHQSLRLDAWILARTVRVLLFGGSRITLDDIPAWALRPERRFAEFDVVFEAAVD